MLYRLAMRLYIDIMDLEGAIGALGQFLALEPENELAQLRYAELLREVGRSTSALPVLTQLVAESTLDGILARAYLHQGHIHLETGEPGTLLWRISGSGARADHRCLVGARRCAFAQPRVGVGPDGLQTIGHQPASQ